MQHFDRSTAILVLAALFVGARAQNRTPQSAPITAVTQSSAANPSQNATPVFDVAAIHLHQPEPHEHNSIWSSPSDGHFKASNISVVMLINWAYEMPEARILGAPGWAANTMFNIDAEANPSVDEQLHGLTSDAGRELKEKMAQALLADRFKLVAHIETRELPIYELVVAKGGAKLGAIEQTDSFVNRWNNRIEVQTSNSVASFAEELSKDAGRPVVDKTGIAGRYDLKLQWTPDDRVSSASSSDSVDAKSAPSLFTALQEQLGLKLEPAKGPVQVLVIDHVEMPTEN